MNERKFVCTSDDLKKIRKITGLTQTVFAQEIGLAGASAISMIENGRSKPSGSTWFAVQKRFGHLFEIQDRGGIQYIEPKPQPALTAQDSGETSERGPSEDTASTLTADIPEKLAKLKLNQEKLEDAVFNMLKTVLRSSNEKAKTDLLSFIILWRDIIESEEKKGKKTPESKGTN
ncbi:MAG: helix-turn-helix transcriptional regulator [Deltaproteobacteria bacterium]|nr:helix-turn-helix transcriptional regulator [Deltaproteobacteria bacterium]